ncbi:MAG: phosphate/phosphite/phosphonate ABC transporter substrate-binding protein [Anaerolineales bacterium]
MNKRLTFMLSIAVVAMVLAACAPAAPSVGTADNPLVWALVPSQDTDAVLTGAQSIAQAVEDATGYVIEPVVTTDFTAAVEAMCNGEAHIGALNTFNYIVAHERGCADVKVASLRFGSSFYAGQIITRPDTGIASVADLAGKTFCRPDPTSTSGWIIPSLSLLAEGLNPETDLADVIDAGGHDGVVLAVLDGTCDAGSTFVDARSNVEEDFPNVMTDVIVIAESAPIPNDTISFHPDLPADMVDEIVAALLTLNDSEEGVALLNSLYSWSGLEAKDDTFYDGFRQQLDAAGMSIEDLLN